MQSEYLFVYGTLRKDANSVQSKKLREHAIFVSEAFYQGKLYKVHDYPAVIPSEQLSDWVYGEVYLLHNPNTQFVWMDDYEECTPEYPEPTEYIRRKVTVKLKSGVLIPAWVYI